jgi:hypothetical protein
MAQCVGLSLPVLHQALAPVPAQFIALVREPRLRTIGVVDSPLEDHDGDAFFRQLPGHQSGAQTSADDHHRPLRQFLRHDPRPLSGDGTPSGEVADRLRIHGPGIRLAAELHHVERMSRRQARVADHLPEHRVAIAAVHGIGEATFGE